MHCLFRDVPVPHNGSRSSMQHELLLKLSFIFHDLFNSMEKLDIGARARKGFINILLCKKKSGFFICLFHFSKNIIGSRLIQRNNLLLDSEYTKTAQSVSNREIFQIKSEIGNFQLSMFYGAIASVCTVI